MKQYHYGHAYLMHLWFSLVLKMILFQQMKVIVNPESFHLLHLFGVTPVLLVQRSIKSETVVGRYKL